MVLAQNIGINLNKFRINPSTLHIALLGYSEGPRKKYSNKRKEWIIVDYIIIKTIVKGNLFN